MTQQYKAVNDILPSKFTIGIPTFNRRDMVCKLVERCLSQKKLPYEIIVSDDASDDGTFEALEKIDYLKLKLIRQHPRIGMVKNWNACLDACLSEWFVLISDDDWIEDTFVEEIDNFIELFTNVELLIVRSKIADRVSGQLIENAPPRQNAGLIDFASDIFPYWSRHDFALPLVGFVFKVDVLRAQGGFSDRLPFAADTDTWIPLAFRMMCGFIPKFLATYVVHRGMAKRTYDVGTVISDSISVRDLLLFEIDRLPCAQEEKKKLFRLAQYHLKRGFGTLMIVAARAGADKAHLLRVWIGQFKNLPGGGLGVLSVGAVLVPEKLIHVIGWPYRQIVWLWRRYLEWKWSRVK